MKLFPRDNKSSCEREITLNPGQWLPRGSLLSWVHVNRPLVIQKVKLLNMNINFGFPPQVKVWGDSGKITIIWRNLIHTKFCKWQQNPSVDNGIQHCMYLCMYYIHCFNWISRLQDLKTFEWFLLSRSLLNFLRTFASLIPSSFFEFGKILPHPRGIRPSFFAPGQEIRQKNCPGGRDQLAQKIFPGVARGDVPSWNWLRH